MPVGDRPLLLAGQPVEVHEAGQIRGDEDVGFVLHQVVELQGAHLSGNIREDHREGSAEPAALVALPDFDIFAELPPSRGRLLSDVDLLVPRERLDSFEQTLLGHGWESVKLEEYDQRYYRTWMHELPPLSHPERGLEVDIHHTISPLTSRLSPDPARLIADSIPLADSRLRILQPVPRGEEIL